MATKQLCIIERIDGEVYVYFESYELHAWLLHNGQHDVAKLVKNTRTALDNECNVLRVLADGEWMVIEPSDLTNLPRWGGV
jgi:hypothetical protein